MRRWYDYALEFVALWSIYIVISLATTLPAHEFFRIALLSVFFPVVLIPLHVLWDADRRRRSKKL